MVEAGPAKKLGDDMNAEKVLVFPACRLEPFLSYFENGVATNPSLIESMLDLLLDPGALSFMERLEAEENPKFKQVIPYCILTRATPYPSYFAYKRTRKGGDSRLFEQWSMGVGGHINPCDAAPSDGYDGPFYAPYAAALRRELYEEVSLKIGPDLSREAPVVALIYDPSNAVGQVHFGVVHLVSVPGDTVLASSDPALEQGTWHSKADLIVAQSNFENWSKLVIPFLSAE